MPTWSIWLLAVAIHFAGMHFALLYITESDYIHIRNRRQRNWYFLKIIFWEIWIVSGVLHWVYEILIVDSAYRFFAFLRRAKSKLCNVR